MRWIKQRHNRSSKKLNSFLNRSRSKHMATAALHQFISQLNYVRSHWAEASLLLVSYYYPLTQWCWSLSQHRRERVFSDKASNWYGVKSPSWSTVASVSVHIICTDPRRWESPFRKSVEDFLERSSPLVFTKEIVGGNRHRDHSFWSWGVWIPWRLYFKPKYPSRCIKAMGVEDKILSTEIILRSPISKRPRWQAGSAMRHQVQRHVAGTFGAERHLDRSPAGLFFGQ